MSLRNLCPYVIFTGLFIFGALWENTPGFSFSIENVHRQIGT
jgi:hypothetical protein